MKSKPQWKTFLSYVMIVVLILFIAFNHKAIAINLIFITSPELPLAIWLFVMLGLGFVLGRSNAFRKNKVKIQ